MPLIKEFLKHLKYSFLLFCLFLFLNCSHSNDERFNMLKKEFKETYHKHIPNDVKTIYIINDNYCPNCVYYFSQFVLDNLKENKQILYFINSKGINVDLQRFIAHGYENVHISKQILNANNELIPNALGVIYIKNMQIDTIIHIDSNSIFDQIAYIKSKN